MVNIYIPNENAESLFKAKPNNEIIQRLRQNKRRKVKINNGKILINYFLNTEEEFSELELEMDSAILNGFDYKTGSLNSLGIKLQIAYDFLEAYKDEPEENIDEVLETYE